MAARIADRREFPLMLLLAIMLLPWTAKFGANHGGVQLASAQTDCPLIGQGIDPYTAGLVAEKPKVFLSVQLKKLVRVDAVKYSYMAYFQVVSTWRDPRVNDTLAINNAVNAFGPAITGLATAKCKPNVTFLGFKAGVRACVRECVSVSGSRLRLSLPLRLRPRLRPPVTLCLWSQLVLALLIISFRVGVLTG
ncbi:unnamed protein product [Closterium sp. NIES-53]